MADDRVLIVEDEPLTADTYTEYLARAGGHRTAHVSPTLADAVRFLSTQRREHGDFGVELVLLDLNLPDGHGLDVLLRMRSAGFTGPVLALTAATDVATVRQAMALGVVQYLVKPFGYREFADRLRLAHQWSTGLSGGGSLPDQESVDRAFQRPGADRSAGGHSPVPLPKGLTEDTLSAVVGRLRAEAGPAGTALSAGEVAAAVGTSRVTARRYLEHLYRQGLVERAPRYGTPGRPENEYRWTGRAG